MAATRRAEMLGGGLASLLRALLIWLLIIAAESAQGALRRFLFDADTVFAARQAAVVVSCVMMFAITWFSAGWLRLQSNRGALVVGALWVALTLAFEVLLGRLTGASWSRLLEDYDLSRGGLMPLGLIAMALTPWLVRRLREPVSAHGRNAL